MRERNTNLTLFLDVRLHADTATTRRSRERSRRGSNGRNKFVFYSTFCLHCDIVSKISGGNK